jgi:hypothetical protein
VDEKEWKALVASTPFHGIMSLQDYEFVSFLSSSATKSVSAHYNIMQSQPINRRTFIHKRRNA